MYKQSVMLSMRLTIGVNAWTDSREKTAKQVLDCIEKYYLIRGVVIQLFSRLTLNSKVEGSNPSPALMSFW